LCCNVAKKRREKSHFFLLFFIKRSFWGWAVRRSFEEVL
jgi:hypothetical protein